MLAGEKFYAVALRFKTEDLIVTIRTCREVRVARSTQFAAFGLIVFLLSGRLMLAQGAGPQPVPASNGVQPETRHLALDVVSIKPGDPNARPGTAGFVADGLHISNYPLGAIVHMAYFQNSRGNELVNMPDWAGKERYDIVGHIDEASAPAWLKLNSRQWQEAGRPMLQKLLVERYKLVAHKVPAQVEGYAVVVGKHGSNLQPAQPRDHYPNGVKDLDPEGGKLLPASTDGTMTFFNALISDLVTVVGAYSGNIIADQTNLTGRYDFTIRHLNPVDADGKRISNPQPSDEWDLSGTGLEIKPAKLPSQNLVIDHIERPTPN